MQHTKSYQLAFELAGSLSPHYHLYLMFLAKPTLPTPNTTNDHFERFERIGAEYEDAIFIFCSYLSLFSVILRARYHPNGLIVNMHVCWDSDEPFEKTRLATDDHLLSHNCPHLLKYYGSWRTPTEFIYVHLSCI